MDFKDLFPKDISFDGFKTLLVDKFKSVEATSRVAKVFITNASDGEASITLFHNNSDYGTEQKTWKAKPGETVGPMLVHFNTGLGSFTIRDYWACEIEVTGGKTPGVFESSGALKYSDWKECQLQAVDAGEDLVFVVDSRIFQINLRSLGTSTDMNRVERKSANAWVTNRTGAPATITLFHNNSTDGYQSKTWHAAPGERVGPLPVYFRTGALVGWIPDYWSVKVAVEGGERSGVYLNDGAGIVSTLEGILSSANLPNYIGLETWKHWKECQLRAQDAGRDLELSVDLDTFGINLPSGAEKAQMHRVAPYAPVDNVFVLMLENHSFDNVFGFSGIPGLRTATTKNANAHDGQTYAAGTPAPLAMPTDPGHEFLDVLEQLCGPGAAKPDGGGYPKIDNSGFVANYATAISEGAPPPTAEHWGKIMRGFHTPTQLPVTYQLATEFAVCDAWHSSIPGPTWPNRFFVHGASSGGWTNSPSQDDITGWMKTGFVYPSGASIFDRLSEAKLKWRVYADEYGSLVGAIPQVSSLKGVKYKINTTGFSSFASDLQSPYPYAYTFIEPNYGDVMGNTYTGGSSQHPMDSMARGEALIKQTYEAIRNSPLWERSLLIITYDEHGGFYDSVEPPAAPPPNDGAPSNDHNNPGGFIFDRYGVRVPAIVISPRIPKGTVDHTLYDHASVPATLEALHGLAPMTDRDRLANTVLPLMSLKAPRLDCPTRLADPAPDAVAFAVSKAGEAKPGPDEPLPASGNTQGFLQVLAKTDIELTRGDPAAIQAIKDRVAAIRTVGEAEAYALEVTTRAELAQAALVSASAPPRPR